MKLETLRNKLLPQLFIIYTRYLIGSAFVFASIVKIKGMRFTTVAGTDYPINSAWHFFETMYQSGLYWKFIGIGQLVAGGLLMTQRFAKLGAAMNLPIITNVFIITLSYYFAYTPVITGLMLLANLMLIVWDWNDFKIFLNLPRKEESKERLENNKVWQIGGLVLFLFTISYRYWVLFYDVYLWIGGCIIISLITLLMGLIANRKLNMK